MPPDLFRFEYLCFFIFVFSFPAAGLLTMVTRWAAKFKMLFWTAYMIQIIKSFAHYFVGTAFGNSIGRQGMEISLFIGFFEYFFVSSLIYGLLIKHPETGRIGFIKGMLVTLYLVSIVFALCIVFIIIFMISTFLIRFL